MLENFKTLGDASKFCKKYDAPIHQQRPWNVFKMAEALLYAYREGANNKRERQTKPGRQRL